MGSFLLVKKFDLSRMTDREYVRFMSALLELIPPPVKKEGSESSEESDDKPQKRRFGEGLRRNMDPSRIGMPYDLMKEMEDDVDRMRENFEDEFPLKESDEAKLHAENCKKILNFIFMQIKMSATLPFEQEKKAARSLTRFMKTYEGILQEPFHDASWRISGIVLDSQIGYCAPSIKTLKLNVYFDALKEEYGAYASTSRYRQRILLSRGARYDSNPKLRKRLGEYFEDLTLYVQAQEVILHTADSKNFITNLNQLIKKTEEKIKLRETPMK